jgi:hypothetical protein
MKKIIVFFFLLISIVSFAQNNILNDTIPKLVITEQGKPIGKIVEKIMNKDGGTIISEDGAVELIIPAGALSKKTTISIQTMTNTFQNGNGLSYRLEPSGIQFQQPVKIIFHYNPEESQDSAQLLMGIAMQDDSGQWYGLDEFTLDTTAKTISANIDHFSIWATFDKLKLWARDHRLKVKKNTEVGIWGVFADKKEMKIRGLSKLKTMVKKPEFVMWNVNGIKSGNAEVGTLEKEFATESADAVRFNNYTAPNNIPDDNPVTISVVMTWIIDVDFIFESELTTQILIYDNAYEVKMTSFIDGISTEEGNTTYQDSGSFVVNLNGAKTKIIEKINKNTADKFEIVHKGCTCKQLDPGNGYIHIVGVSGITVTPATPTQPARVKIQFLHTPLKLPLLQFTCDEPPNQYTFTNASANAVFRSMHAYPQNIEFTAREEEGEWQIYETGFNIKEGVQTPGRILIKYIIRRLKDDE